MQSEAPGLGLALDAAGAVVLLLLICAALVVTVVAVSGYRLWSAGRRSDEVLQRVEALGREDRYDDALTLVRETPGPVAAVLAAGLERAHAPVSGAAEAALTLAALEQRAGLERGLGALAATGAVALLLGLLALVLGLLDATRAVAATDRLEAARGVAGLEAGLLGLALGLGVALMAAVGRYWLLGRVRRLAIEMAKGTAVALGIVWDRASR